MKEIVYEIKDPLGIHARPAGLLIKKLQEFQSAVTITRGSDTCDGVKLLALMKMRVKTGETLSLRFEGPDEESAAAAIAAFLSENL